MNEQTRPVDQEIIDIFSLFLDETPVSAELIDTSRGEEDFRNTYIIGTAEGNRIVLKITANEFTFPEKIRMWARTIDEYRGLGYYCPKIFCDKNGGFPVIRYKGRDCVAYAEEFSKYGSFEERISGDADTQNADTGRYLRDIWTMTAKIAAKRLDYTEYPSAWCLYDTFEPSDETDEVMGNALEWKKTAEALPGELSEQVRRIWDRWTENREALEGLYRKLPASVFQADLNSTNLLVDEDGNFKGVCDFNLCGKEVFLNYLMRENFDDFEKEIGLIREALRVASETYDFNEDEKKAALPLYRCLKPLWYTRVCDLQEAGNDPEKVRECLDRIEHYQTADIDFAGWMGGPGN